MQGYLRSDGRKGIRNVIVVAYLVECAHHVAREITQRFRGRPDIDVHLIGFPGCYPNVYASKIMKALCTHPNVGGALLVSLGCECFNRTELMRTIADSGRPVGLQIIQETGGTRKTIDGGVRWIESVVPQVRGVPRVEVKPGELIIGTICGGSDATSGLTANPVIGEASDLLVDAGGTSIFEETGELFGCEHHMAGRAATPELGQVIIDCVAKAAHYYETLGHSSFASGNAEGGLTTIEEKSLGAYSKSGTRPIRGLIKPGDRPPTPGLYLMDVVPDGEVRFGFPNISDNAEIVELIASGSHVILFSTGRGSVVGSAISPVVKVCANPETYRRMSDDMDIDAGRILENRGTLKEVGRELYEKILRTAEGEKTCSESLGHQEFILTYKTFEPLGPACLPVLR